jgi:proteasome accessory factor C
LRRDLFSLVTRYDAPVSGFVEGMQLFLEADRVSSSTNHFARPMRLSVPELCALELGLAVLRVRRTPGEHAAIDGARARLRAVIARLPGDPIGESPYAVSLGGEGNAAALGAVRLALRERRTLRVTYRKSGSDTSDEHVIHPYALLAASGMLYVVAYSEARGGMRVFRMDRVEAATMLEGTFERVAEFSLDALLRAHGGPLVLAGPPETLRVRYSPRVARWIAEREGRPLGADGSLVMEHPLADPEWALRHVLQYGADAEVLEPASVRVLLRERLGQMRTASGE